MVSNQRRVVAKANAQSKTLLDRAKDLVRKADLLDAASLAAVLADQDDGHSDWQLIQEESTDASSPRQIVKGQLRSKSSRGDHRPDYDFELISSADALPPATREDVWQLFEVNMKSMYQLNDAWNRREKELEWWGTEQEDSDGHVKGRWLLIWDTSSNDRRQLVGFLLFRFDLEQCSREDVLWKAWRSTAPIQPVPAKDLQLPVGYCYEVHVSHTYQGRSVGTHLLQALETLSRATSMRKTMLTCWACNSLARRVYSKRNYNVDAISPAEEDTEPLEQRKGYLIMSKAVELS